MKKLLMIIFSFVITNFMCVASNNTHSDSIMTDFGSLHSEIENLRGQLRSVQNINVNLNEHINSLDAIVISQRDSLRYLYRQLADMERSLNSNSTHFSEGLSMTNADLMKFTESINMDFHKLSLYSGIGALIITLVFIGFYILAFNRIRNISKTTVNIQETQIGYQEKSLELGNSLLSIIDCNRSKSGNDIDHSLALKVADEVVRIEMNLYRMDNSIKGYKQLSKAVERIKNNFAAQGYEIVNMIGKPYNEGMRINADFVIDETLQKGSQIITSITKPQINYKGQMIQKAIVTVSQNI